MKKYCKFRTTSVLLALLLVSSLLVTQAQAGGVSPNGDILNLNLEASESVTIVSTGTDYTFTLNGTTWTSNGTAILTVAANAFTSINITDSGTGASVTFGNSSGNFQDNFNITLDAGSGTVTVANSTDFVGGSSLSITADTINVNASVSTDNDSILLSADAMTIAAMINAGTDIVTLQPLSAGQLIDLGGADVAGTLGLTDAELDQITAGILRIGSSGAGDISFTATINPAGTDTLSLITGDEIVDAHSSGSDVQVANLALQTVNGVADNNPIILDMEVGTVAARNTGIGGISILEVFNGGALIVGTVDGVVGIRNEAATGSAPTLGIQLETTNGDLTVNADIFNERRNIFLVAQQGNGDSGDSTFINNANITAARNNGQIRIDANNMILAGGSTISGPDRVTLQDDPSATVPIAINLGGADSANTLGLTDAELDTVSTNGTLRIGHTNGGGTGDIAVTAPIDLTDGSSIPTTELISGGVAILGSGGNVLTTNILNLTAGTTIGSNGNPFAVSATELTTVGNGDQFLSEADSLTWNTSNADSGTITLDGGTFLTGNGETITATTVAVDNAATLGGTGTVVATVNAQNGSTMAPGLSPGILTTGDVTLNAGSNFNLEVNGTTTAGTDYDQLNATGTVTINSAANLVITGTVSQTSGGAALVIINNDDNDAVSGTFDGLPDGATVTVNTQEFRIFYNGGDGNDVVLFEATPPSLTSFTRQTPTTSPTNADSLVFRATFNEDVENLDAIDFAVDGTTAATVTDVTPVSARVYDVTVSGGDLADFEGEVGLDLSGSQDIEDLVGNPLPAGEPGTDETYLVDNSAPEISGITLLSPTGTISDTLPPFSWTAANDPGSGVVSYTLQLTDSSTTQALSVTGTSHTPNAALFADNYTWTVKAHDAAGNFSEFVSPAASFTLEPVGIIGDHQIFLPIVISD